MEVLSTLHASTCQSKTRQSYIEMAENIMTKHKMSTAISYSSSYIDPDKNQHYSHILLI